ncbi:MAG: hypothetical protein ACSHXF_16870 [Aquaticitalea sp.]
MKYIKILLLFIFIHSCKTDTKPELQTDTERNDTFAMYGLLMEEFNYSNGILREQLTDDLTEKKLNEIHSVKIYDSLTKQYLNLLDQTYSELINSANIQDQTNYFGELSKKSYVNDYFFVGSDYSESGTEFVSKTENYRNGILELVTNKNLAKRINGILDTKDITNREGKQVKHLNYLYKDMPLISVLTFLKHKEKSVLEFENEYLKNIELNN